MKYSWVFFLFSPLPSPDTGVETFQGKSSESRNQAEGRAPAGLSLTSRGREGETKLFLASANFFSHCDILVFQ